MAAAHTKSLTLSGVGIGTLTTVNAAAAESIRRHFSKKATYVQTAGKDYTKVVNPNGFNPYAVLYYARKSSVETAKKVPTDVFLQLGNYTFEDFQSERARGHLKEPYARWNTELNCLELAKKRFIPKSEKFEKKQKGDESVYYPQNEEYSYVPVPPGLKILYADFNGIITRDNENAVFKIMDLCPKFKNPETIETYPKDPDFNWYIGQVSFNIYRIPPLVFPDLMLGLGFSLYQAPNPKKGDHTRYLALKLVDWFDTATFTAEISRPQYAITKLNPNTDPLAWVFESTKASKATAPVLCVDPNDANKKSNSKCMKLWAVLRQKSDPNSDVAETVAMKINFWEEAVEEMFGVRDLTLWYHGMRFVAAAMAPAALICSVNRPRTEGSTWNNEDSAAVNATGDGEGELLTLDAEPQSPAGGESGDGDAHTQGSVDFDALMEAEEKKNKNAAAQNSANESVDFFLDLTVQRPVIDRYRIFQQFLIPVTLEWVTHPMPGKGGLRPYRCPTSGNYNQLNLKKPSELPDVICLSEYKMSKDDVKTFEGLVQRGEGEFRVAVNTPTYYNESNNQAFVEAIRKLTPAEGAMLLDGIPIPGVNIVWSRPEQAQYVLFFLNNAKRKAEQIESDTKKTIEVINKLILRQDIYPLS